ncbi:uncharacterized protein LOC107495875 [Arachis duranensis]|uniref:Uncharacterized protein LOC107495875 n=1 Tax=Arachis duranensis TaxID=130453 RepID=A0A6P4DXX9_ARADU|nr:uncharacterized protein LOC107495875 [Arachis duranensis]
MKGKGQSQNIFVRIMVSPIRALGKARDMYVRSIIKCGDSMNYSNPMDAANRFSALSRSHSAATSRRSEVNDEDFAELMRAASARTLANRIDVDYVLKQQHQHVHHNSKGLPKSSSVGMARIDEENDYAEGSVGGGGVGGGFGVPELYPRSKSYAVSKTHNVAAF